MITRLDEIRARMFRRRQQAAGAPMITIVDPRVEAMATTCLTARIALAGDVLDNGWIVCVSPGGVWPQPGGTCWISVDKLERARAHGWRAQREASGEPMVAAPDLVAVRR